MVETLRFEKQRTKPKINVPDNEQLGTTVY